MIYRFGKPKLTCVEIEKELGLARGEVKKITVYQGDPDVPDGTVEVDAGIELTSPQRDKLKSFFESRREEVVR